MRHNLPDGSVATGGASPYSSMRGKQLTVASSNPISSPTSPWDIQSSQSPWNNTSASASNSPLRIVPGSSPSSTMTANSFSPKESGLGTGTHDNNNSTMLYSSRGMDNNGAAMWQANHFGKGANSASSQSAVVMDQNVTLSHPTTMPRKEHRPLRSTFSRMFSRNRPSRWSTSAPSLGDK